MSKIFEVFIAKGRWKDRNEDLYYCDGAWSTSIDNSTVFFSKEVLELCVHDEWQDVEEIKIISCSLTVNES